jgi:glycine cleavage system P protein (glycine dehydrogenase) subunit 1
MSPKQDTIVYPYIPNSVPATKKQMLAEVNANSIEDLYQEIPDRLRLKRDMNMPDPYLSEYALKRHVEGLLAKNVAAGEYLSFLGAGCYQHHVPAVCDEINQRNEFVTAYSGRAYEDHGRFQALFEYASMMGELLNMDVVNLPTYDGYQAAATSIRMAARMTGRSQVLVGHPISPDKLCKILDYSRPDLQIKLVGYDRKTGQLDMDALRATISEQVAAVYLDNPNYFGCVETQGDEIAQIAHQHGALCLVGVDPISLGVLTPPVEYGADIVCGDIQPLGMHMQYGGGQAGFIATPDEERFIAEYPTRLVGIAPTLVPGEYGFGEVAFERTSFIKREGGKEWLGTMANLWGITAGVYLALLGPQGIVELGEGIMLRAQYAMKKLAEIQGVQAPRFRSPHFSEFIVNFDGTGKTVAEINQALLAQRILGGYDLGREFPELGQSALYCVSEVHSQADMDTLIQSLRKAVRA